MGRTLTGRRLVIASHNPGKLREIAELLSPHGIETVSAWSLDLREPEETGQSFAENAAIKALAAATGAGLPALADDSGLVVPALGGRPGSGPSVSRHVLRPSGSRPAHMSTPRRMWSQ